MGFLSRNRQDRVLEPSVLPVGVTSYAGENVSADSALRLTAVWSCVRLLSDTVSTLPIDVYRNGEKVATPPILVSPTAGQSRPDWVYQVMVSLLLRGNAYGLITARSGATMLPAQVDLVNPDVVSVSQINGGPVEYRIGGRTYSRDDVWHVRAYPLPGLLTGLSPVEYARQAIGLGLAAEKFGAQFFGGGATPSGILSSERSLSSQQTDTLAARWRAMHEGRHRTAILSGDLKFTPVSIAPDESQFLETQKFTVAQVARIFGVPPEMVGGESGGSLTYANVESRALDFLRYSLQPWFIRLETALSELLPRQQTVKFNPEGLLRATTKERYDAHKVALDAGFLTVDEVRALEDLPPLGGTND